MSTWSLLFLIAFSHSPGKLVVSGIPSEEECIKLQKHIQKDNAFGVLSEVKAVCIKEKK